MSIPKVIHYCWFGGSDKPELAMKCIESWKEYCPDYDIKEWNERNYNISSAPLYVRQAYEMKKWAFVTDYVRLDVINQNGGIYLDTDVELLDSLDSFLNHEGFFAFQDNSNINTGLGFGAVAGTKLLKEIAADYEVAPFVLSDGSCDQTPCPERNTVIFEKYGLIKNGEFQILNGEIAIYPKEYFNPKSFETGEINMTDRTVSIHHFDGSWMEESRKRELREYYKVTRWLGVDMGERLLLMKRIIKNEGVISLVKQIWLKVRCKKQINK